MNYVQQVPLFPKHYIFIFTHSPSLNEESIDQPSLRIFKLVFYTADTKQHIWKQEAI